MREKRVIFLYLLLAMGAGFLSAQQQEENLNILKRVEIIELIVKRNPSVLVEMAIHVFLQQEKSLQSTSGYIFPDFVSLLPDTTLIEYGNRELKDREKRLAKLKEIDDKFVQIHDRFRQSIRKMKEVQYGLDKIEEPLTTSRESLAQELGKLSAQEAELDKDIKSIEEEIANVRHEELLYQDMLQNLQEEFITNEEELMLALSLGWELGLSSRPNLHGKIVAVYDEIGEVTIEPGLKAGFVPGMNVEVFQQDKKVADITIRRVYEDSAVAYLSTGKVAIGDEVIALCIVGGEK